MNPTENVPLNSSSSGVPLVHESWSRHPIVASFPFLIHGAVLAGGRSSRMGVPKCSLELPTGETMLKRGLNLLSALNVSGVVVGTPPSGVIVPENVTVLPDSFPHRGPLGGLAGLLASKLASYYIVLACDQPLLEVSLLRRLLMELDARPTVFTADNSLLPLPGLYPASLLPVVESCLASPHASLKHLLQQTNARTIALSDSEQNQLRGANTPQEFAELVQALRA